MVPIHRDSLGQTLMKSGACGGFRLVPCGLSCPPFIFTREEAREKQAPTQLSPICEIQPQRDPQWLPLRVVRSCRLASGLPATRVGRKV